MPSYEQPEPESVPLVDSAHEDSRWYTEHPRHARSEPTIDRVLLVAACIISLISLAWNAALFSSSSEATAAAHLRNLTAITTSAENGMIDVSALRRPSLYQGLERVPEIKVQLQIEALRMQGQGNAGQATSSMVDPARPTVRPVGSSGVRASSIARINSRHPNAHYPEDGWVLLTDEDRALLLCDSHNTDLNSDSCVFAYTFPARVDLKDKLLTIENPETPTVAPLILITSLNVPEHLDLKATTWNSSPDPQSLLGAIPAEFGANGTTEAFECPQNGQLLFELACATPGCRVEYKDDDGEPLLGIRLMRVSN